MKRRDGMKPAGPAIFATISWCFEWSPLAEKSVKGCQQMAT